MHWQRFFIKETQSLSGQVTPALSLHKHNCPRERNIATSRVRPRTALYSTCGGHGNVEVREGVVQGRLGQPVREVRPPRRQLHPRHRPRGR
jgi:hypothetical protein